MALQFKTLSGSMTIAGIRALAWVILAGAVAAEMTGCVAPVENGEEPSSDVEAVAPILNAKVAPGKNFDLSVWQLQEPIGSPGSPKTISPQSLEGGYADAYFHTDPTDGAMTFWDPENGVHTQNSNFARSELREMNPDGSAANWAVSGTHSLAATVKVTKVPSSVCVGQIHIGTALKSGLESSTKPLLELYYHKNGDIVLGLEDSPSGGQRTHTLGNVKLGTSFSYRIDLAGSGAITITLNGTKHDFTMPSGFKGYGEYFKIGDYDQTSGSDGSVGATVKVYALKLSHTS